MRSGGSEPLRCHGRTRCSHLDEGRTVPALVSEIAGTSMPSDVIRGSGDDTSCYGWVVPSGIVVSLKIAPSSRAS
jgi:hypothetical protein